MRHSSFSGREFAVISLGASIATNNVLAQETLNVTANSDKQDGQTASRTPTAPALSPPRQGHKQLAS